MFEQHVVSLLQRYLGNYVRGLSVEALKISVWEGDVLLNDLQLKAEALNALNLPIVVKTGFLGSIRLKVPWNKLGQEPVIVLLDKIFLLAEPATDDWQRTNEDENVRLQAKLRRIEDAELAMVEAKEKKPSAGEQPRGGKSWLESLISTIIGNLKLSITNVHIRYEDTVSNPGHPFCTGITLASLATATIDERGIETFLAHGVLDELRKSVRLDRLAIYHDSNHNPWKIAKDWSKLTPREWCEIFEPGIRQSNGMEGVSQWEEGRQYLLRPLGGKMIYVRHGKHAKRDPGDPFHRVTLTLDEVSLTASEAQYCDAMKLLENFTNFRTRVNYADLRPRVPLKENRRAWWQYALQAVLRQKRQISSHMNWDQVYRHCQLRKKYVPLYAKLLQAGSKGDHPEIRAIDAEVDEEVVLLWRMVAHMQAKRTKSKEAANAQKVAQKAQKQTWWTWAWGGGGAEKSETGTEKSAEHEDTQHTGLSKEEWDKLYELTSYAPELGLPSGWGLELPNMMQLAVKLDIIRFAVDLMDPGGQVVGGAFENLSTEVEIFAKMIRCSLSLAKYGVSAPEGQLIQSVKRSGRDQALVAKFVYAPLDEPFDWKLYAAIAPCYITVWRKTYDRLVNFLKSSEDNSPGVVFETAAALQSKLEEVQRTAQEQLRLALQEETRFSLDLDIDAPKLSTPVDMSNGGPRGAQLLLDLGHFTLQTAPTEATKGDPTDNLYMQFKVTGSDISAFIVEGEYCWSEEQIVSEIKGPACLVPLSDASLPPDSSPISKKGSKTVLILPVLDKCGMTVTFQQIRAAHPSVPSTRIAARLPFLGFHFSPARYHRLMQILAVLSPDDKAKGPAASVGALPWLSPSFSGYIHVLQWEGISKTTAFWERRYAVLSGAYLYILEAENSRTYLRYARLTGKQVVEVQPEFIGGYTSVIAVSHRGLDVTKVAESVHAIVLRLPTKELKETWMENLMMAIYKSSGHVPLLLTEGEEEKEDNSSREQPLAGRHQVQRNVVEGVTVYLVGVLDELRISISGKSACDGGVWSDEECALLELHACGSKVELRQREFDLSIGVGLHSLQFEDKLFGPCKFLASSVVPEPPSEENDSGNIHSAVAIACVEGMQEDNPMSCAVSTSTVQELGDVDSSSAGGRIDGEDSTAKGGGEKDGEEEGIHGHSDDEEFLDAAGEFESLPSSPGTSPSRSTRLRYHEKESIVDQPGLEQFGLSGKLLKDAAADLSPPSFSKPPGLLDSLGEGSRAVDFVKMIIFVCQTDSPDYDDTDTEVRIQLATLDFFLNRPIIAALMEFGGHLGGSPNEPVEDKPGLEPIERTESGQGVEQSELETQSEEKKEIIGLLGRGKARVVFRLFMAMDSARIHLNLEDGSELALLSQDRLQTDIKMYPASFSVDARLGNLRVCDSALEETNPWRWMCDMNDEGKDSLVQLEFTSYNMEEDDYPGYDYRLHGALSAVRIVFLYRFIQELMAYFQGLVTPHAQQMVKVVVKVRGVERVIEQSEMQGGVALKLDVSMENPVIIMPSSSNSTDFMQLQPGHMTLSNQFEWRGGDESVPEAVRLDIMHIQIEDANFMVGFEGMTAQPMVQDMAGLKVMFRRPLRDLFHAVPSIEIDVQMDKLRAVMSNKEYDLITQCASSNMAEEPKLPVDFRRPSVPPPHHGGDEIPSSASARESQLDVEVSLQDSISSQGETFTAMRINVNVGHTEFELYNGRDRESSLAGLEICGLWVSYRSSSNGELHVLWTLPLVSIYDNRPDTKPEMRLMVGPITDLDKAVMICSNRNAETSAKPENSLVSMFVGDCNMYPNKMKISMRIQRPRVLVALDFLLAIARFFVPSWRDERSMEEDPLWAQDDIRLRKPVFKQESPVVYLGPKKQLIVDAPDVNDFVYNGQFNTLVLPSVETTDTAPLIIVASRKRLRFMNIRLKNGFFLDKYVHLGSNSSYSAAAEDGVIVEDSPFEGDEEGSDISSDADESGEVRDQEEKGEFAINVQAVSPEFTFYDDTKWPEGSPLRPERLLRAKMDFNIAYVNKGDELWVATEVKGLAVEGNSGLMVLEPFDASADYGFADGKTEINFTSSEIVVRLSFKVMALIKQLHENLMSSIFIGSSQLIQPCTHFDRIWVKEAGEQEGQGIAIWRPKAPRGFAIVGDCATSGKMPPARPVIAVSEAFRRVSRPVGFELLWSLSSDISVSNPSEVDQMGGSIGGGSSTEGSADTVDECRIWMPIAPPGYAALGCVCQRGKLPPPTTAVYCVRADLLTSTVVSDCVYYTGSDDGEKKKSCAIWQIDNSVGTFFATTGDSSAAVSVARDVSEVLRFGTAFGVEGGKLSEGNNGQTRRSQQISGSGPKIDSPKAGLYITVGKFDRVWWHQGRESGRPITIWRPSPPAGYCSIGDIAVRGYEPPACGVAILDDDSGILAKPERFRLMARPQGRKEASVWYPIAPEGYAALGCIAVQGFYPPSPEQVRCVRKDLVHATSHSEKPMWISRTSRSGHYCSFWKVHNQAQTFLCIPGDGGLPRHGPRKPAPNLAFDLEGFEKEQLPDNLCIKVHVERLSCTLFDTLAGTMVPLVEATASTLYSGTFGRSEMPVAVAMAWLSASTFNNVLGAWEPFIEPFEALLKYESNTDEGNVTEGSTVRINASNVVNVNFACAGLNSMINAYAAFLKSAKIEEIARKQLSMITNDEGSHAKQLARSALNEENLLKVVVINRTGSDLFLRTVDDGFSEVRSVSSGDKIPVHMPPPTFPQTTMPKAERSRQFLAVRVVQAKRLPVPSDELTELEYVCSLELNVKKKEAKEPEKTVSPRARTRCIQSCIDAHDRQCQRGQAVWNEVFIFEIPQEEESSLAILVTNQAANGGRGVHIGAAVIPITAAMLKEERQWSSMKELRGLETEINWAEVPHDDVPLRPYCPSPEGVKLDLRKDSAKKAEGEVEDLGYVTLGECFFTVGPKNDFHEIVKRKGSFNDRESGSLQVSTRPTGPWTGFQSNFAFSTEVRMVNGVNLAVSVQQKPTYKCLEFRSLAVIHNLCDIPLEVSLCRRWLAEADDKEIDRKPGEEVEEEVFENQRFSLLTGWGSKWPGNLLPRDPGRFSNRDNSKSSQTMLQINLPPGWKWSTDWQIDRRAYVDKDGWYYGMDFSSMQWPPSSPRARTRGPFDFVRRMRRFRKRTRESDATTMGRRMLGVLEPAAKMEFPWLPMEPDSDFCVQVRPHVSDDSLNYNWGRANLLGEMFYSRSSDDESEKRESRRKKVPAHLFMLSNLSTTQELLLCKPSSSSSSQRPTMEGSVWLCMDCIVQQNDVVSEASDWQLTVRPPLTIENLLPLKAELQVFDKASQGAKPILRLNEIAESGQGVQVYTVDIRRPVFLGCFPQGGWRPEKEFVLIFDLVAELRSSFLMLNQYSHRKLSVLIEHDRGDMEGSPVIVRLSVPYWLMNATGLPLAYHIVEVEPAKEPKSPDSSWLTTAAKAAKKTKRLKVNSPERGRSVLRSPPLRKLEELEDTPNGEPVMLSIHNVDLDRVGLAITIMREGSLNLAVPFREFDEKADLIELEAMDSKGHYVRVSAIVDMSSAGNERTKVIKLLPRTLFLNRIGKTLILRQKFLKNQVVIHPYDGGVPMTWESSQDKELLQVRTEDSDWSQPFGVDMEGVVHVSMRALKNGRRETIRADVSKGAGRSSMAVFRKPSVQGPYRIENRTAMLPIRFKQKGADEESWQILIPGSTSAFAWEDLQKERSLEIMVDGTKQSLMGVYDIDKPGVYSPMSSSRVVSALRLCVFEELAIQVVRLEDLKPGDNENTIFPRRSFSLPTTTELAISIPSTAGRLTYLDGGPQSPDTTTGGNMNGVKQGTKKFNLIIKMEEFGISIIDHKPQELLYISMQTATLSYMIGLGEGISRIKFKLSHLQIDNQLPETSMPVLLAPHISGRGKEGTTSRSDTVMKCTLTTVEEVASKEEVYPFIGIQFFCDHWQVRIHEPVLWRLQEAFNQLDFGQLTSQEESETVSVDPYVRIGSLIVSEIPIRVSLAMSPSLRPRGVLGFWAKMASALSNTNNLSIKLHGRIKENIYMRKSEVVRMTARSIRNDLLSQPFQLLWGFSVLGNVSTALGQISEEMAALSRDKKFLRSREKESKQPVEDLGDGLLEGGHALLKGVFRGVSGLVLKPLEGAKDKGVEGFVQGVGKGIIGAATQPVSGVLDLLSKTTDGVNATKSKLEAIIKAAPEPTRKRPPRPIVKDKILRPFNYDDNMDVSSSKRRRMFILDPCASTIWHADILKKSFGRL